MYWEFQNLFEQAIGSFNFVSNALIVFLALVSSILVVVLPLVAIYKIVRLFACAG